MSEAFRVIGSLHGLKFAKEPFGKTLDSALQVLIRNAAREWLRAVILRIPVWTGQSLGSIKFAEGPGGNLARFLNVAVPIVPHPRARVTGAKNQNSQPGSWNTTSGQHRYRFFFHSNVEYMIHHEFFERTDRGASGQPSDERGIIAPWHALEDGGRAFNDEIERGKAKLPRIQDAIKTYKIGIS